jgi:hypothetical protein
MNTPQEPYMAMFGRWLAAHSAAIRAQKEQS